jgi:hypothetical protein
MLEAGMGLGLTVDGSCGGEGSEEGEKLDQCLRMHFSGCWG